MTNEDALTHLEELVREASLIVQQAVWAQAFLSYGGEATWDAVKDVSRAAGDLALTAQNVAKFEARFEEIIP